MNHRFGLMVLAGCVPAGSGVEDSGSVRDVRVEMEWQRGWVNIDFLFGRPEETYRFGIAETGLSCAEAAVECWTGEDCLNGPYCHPASFRGLSLLYLGDPQNLNVGTETVFVFEGGDTPYLLGSLTFFLEEVGSGRCYVSGHDPTYYAEQECEPSRF